MSEQLREALARVANGLWDFLADIDIGEETLWDLEQVIAAARALLDGETIWWCEKHRSTVNPVLYASGPPDKTEMWGACHDSLWTFAAGQGTDANGDPTIGKCRMVEAVLTVKETKE